MKLILYVIISFLIFSCTSPSKKKNPAGFHITDSVRIQYAKGFKIYKSAEGTILHLINPWQEAEDITYQYLITDNTKHIPQGDSYQVIRKPIKKVVVFSTTQIAFLDELGVSNCITGISGPQYVCHPQLKKRIKNGEVQDVGYENQINYELILQQKPDVIFTYGLNSQVAGFVSRLKDFGIPVIICGEYLENHPLARAEWIKFFSTFFDKDELANEKFHQIDSAYCQLLSSTSGISERPLVFSGFPWRDKWYVAGSNTFSVQFIRDAGGEYMWPGLNEKTTYPMSLESVISHVAKGDFWINSGTAASKKEIIGMDERFRLIKAFQTDHIYNNTAQALNNAGNNYWERGTVEPHIILKDLIHIFHPEILPRHELVYYVKLK